MKRILLLFISILSAAIGFAQNDAVYVYRNDGMINAFLKSDIERMCYSKIDVDSVKRNDYVVQEIWTADSIYRIPLAAIDSIGNTTPPTIYKEGAVVIEDSWLDYIISVDEKTLTLYFKHETPSEILPSIGDNLITMEISDVLPHGFIGKVESFSYNTEAIEVACSSLSLTDVFEQYYSTFKIDTSSQSQKRKALIAERTWGPASYSPTPLHIDLTPEVERFFKRDLDRELSFSVMPRFVLDVAPTYTGKASLFVMSDRRVVCTLDLESDYKVHNELGASGKIKYERDFPWIQVPIELPIPLCQIYTNIGGVLRADATLSFDHESEQTYRTTMHMEVSNRDRLPWIRFSNGTHDTSGKTKWMIDGKFQAGFYGEVGISFLHKDVLSFGYRGEEGIELGGNAVLYSHDSENEFHSTELYKSLLNTNLYLKGYYTTGSQTKVLWFDWAHDFEPLCGGDTIVKGSLVPRFRDTKIERDSESPGDLFVSTKVDGHFMPFCEVGWTLFEGTLNADDGIKEEGESMFNEPVPGKEFYATFWNKKAPSYTVYPSVRLFGIEMLAEPKAELEPPLPEIINVEKIWAELSDEGFYYDGVPYRYKYEVKVEAGIESLEGVYDWGIVYKDPMGQDISYSLKSQGTRRCYFDIYSNQNPMSSSAHTYVIYNGGEKKFGVDYCFDLSAELKTVASLFVELEEQKNYYINRIVPWMYNYVFREDGKYVTDKDVEWVQGFENNVINELLHVKENIKLKYPNGLLTDSQYSWEIIDYISPFDAIVAEWSEKHSY